MFYTSCLAQCVAVYVLRGVSDVLRCCHQRFRDGCSLFVRIYLLEDRAFVRCANCMLTRRTRFQRREEDIDLTGD